MKNTLLIIFLSGIIITGCVKDETVIPTIRATSISSGVSTSLNAVCFNGNRGFIAGNNGVVLRSEGGDIWTKVPVNITGADLFSISFPSAQVGYITGSGRLLKTIDGGETWTLRNSSHSFLDACFPTVDIGYTISGSYVYKTTDGGQTWNTNMYSFSDPRAIEASGPDNVFVSDYWGEIFLSKDGGITWINVGPEKTWQMYFRNNTTGYAIAQGNFIYRSTDDGFSWQRAAGTEEFLLRSIHFPTPEKGYAVGDGCIYVSDDGGRNWESRFTQDGTSIGENLWSVYFKDEKTGYAVTHEGEIYKLQEEK